MNNIGGIYVILNLFKINKVNEFLVYYILFIAFFRLNGRGGELTISLSDGQRITNSDRFFVYYFYLNVVLFKIMKYSMNINKKRRLI